MGNQSIAFSNLAFNSKCRLTKAFGQSLPGGLAGLLSTDRWRVDLEAPGQSYASFGQAVQDQTYVGRIRHITVARDGTVGIAQSMLFSNEERRSRSEQGALVG
jgi:hypothetical protein